VRKIGQAFDSVKMPAAKKSRGPLVEPRKTGVVESRLHLGLPWSHRLAWLRAHPPRGFYCNRRYAAATSLRGGCGRSGSSLSRSTYSVKYASLLRASACPSRSASRRFLHEAPWTIRARRSPLKAQTPGSLLGSVLASAAVDCWSIVRTDNITLHMKCRFSVSSLNHAKPVW
jgi:hypothetical protein